MAWANDRSPWKAFQDIQSIGNNHWVRMLAPDLSLHSRSVIQGLGCTLGSCCLCLVATQFPQLQTACTILHRKLTSTQHPHVYTHTAHRRAIIDTNQYSGHDYPVTPPKSSRNRGRLCDQSTPPSFPAFDFARDDTYQRNLRMLKMGDDADVHERRLTTPLLTPHEHTPPRKRRLALAGE